MSSSASAAATFGCSSFRRWTRDPCQLIRLASWRAASPASARGDWRFHAPFGASRAAPNDGARAKLPIVKDWRSPSRLSSLEAGKRLDRASPSLGN